MEGRCSTGLVFRSLRAGVPAEPRRGRLLGGRAPRQRPHTRTTRRGDRRRARRGVPPVGEAWHPRAALQLSKPKRGRGRSSPESLQRGGKLRESAPAFLMDRMSGRPSRARRSACFAVRIGASARALEGASRRTTDAVEGRRVPTTTMRGAAPMQCDGRCAVSQFPGAAHMSSGHARAAGHHREGKSGAPSW